MIYKISCRPGLSYHRFRRGAVLILVLWLVLGLVSIALVFGNTMMLEYRSAENTAAGLRSEHAIDGACAYAQYILANWDEPGTLPDIDTYESERVVVGDAVFWMIGRGMDGENETTPTFGITDEASKLNLNTATEEMLRGLPEMTDELAAAIIDWRDSDSELTENGAESDAYLMRTPKYTAKNSPFETIEELHLVMGAEWVILVGEDTNRNGVLDPNEDDGPESPPDDNRNGRLEPGILEYVTVYSRESNTSADGTERTDINDQQALSQLLQETFGQSRANALLQAAGAGGNFTSVLEFKIRSRMSDDEFSQIADKLTVSDDDTVEGLINVNTAGAAVLACIPGIGTAYADQLVAYRLSNSDSLDTIGWVAEILGEENAILAGPYLTAKSYQYSVDIVATSREGRGYRRVLFILDTSSGTPTVIYRRDLSRLGWALGRGTARQLVLQTEI